MSEETNPYLTGKNKMDVGVAEDNGFDFGFGDFFSSPTKGTATWLDWNKNGQSGLSELGTAITPVKGTATAFDWDKNGQSGISELASKASLADWTGLGKLGFDIYAGLGKAKAAKEANKINRERLAFDKKSTKKNFNSNVQEYNNQQAGLNSLRDAVHTNRLAANDSVGNVNYGTYLDKWNGGNNQTYKPQYKNTAGLGV